VILRRKKQTNKTKTKTEEEKTINKKQGRTKETNIACTHFDFPVELLTWL